MRQAPGEGNFWKGLAVVDDVAYFGISPRAERSMRADPKLDCELAAFQLLENRLLWRRKVQFRLHGPTVMAVAGDLVESPVNMSNIKGLCC